MRFLEVSGLKVLSCSLGSHDRLVALPAEAQAFTSHLAAFGDYIPGTSDIFQLTDGVPGNVGFLWNWPSMGSTWGSPKIEPLPGLLLSFESSDVTRPVGAQINLSWQFKSQVSGGYTGGAPAGGVVHSAILEFLPTSGVNGVKVGIIPAQVVNGKPCLSLPVVSNDASSVVVTVSGLPPGMRAFVRVATRHDVEFAALWPDIARHFLVAP